jgi:prepilin-type N-terminal cleavage/methylation domain-containing protein
MKPSLWLHHEHQCSLSRQGQKGFTLVELMIVITLLAGMLIGVMYVIISGQDIFNEGTMTSYLESEGNRLIDIIKDNINECKVITASAPTTTNNYALLAIQVPVLVGGSYWNTTTGAVYWGAYDNNNQPQQGWHITYSFVPTTTNLNEAVTKLDYNRDNDITDSFDVGDIWMYMYSAYPETVANLQNSVKLGSNVITVANQRYLDINNDGVDDPIFSFLDDSGNPVTDGGNRIRINIWLSGIGARQTPIIVNCRTDAVLFNPQ